MNLLKEVLGTLNDLQKMSRGNYENTRDIRLEHIGFVYNLYCMFIVQE